VSSIAVGSKDIKIASYQIFEFEWIYQGWALPHFKMRKRNAES